MDLNTNDVPKLGVVLPTNTGTEPMITLPLVLPIGWKNSPPDFSTSTETVSDLVNQRLIYIEYQPPDHRLDQMAAKVPLTNWDRRSLDPVPGVAAQVPCTCDPSLPTMGTPLEYVDIFVDNFVSLGQAANTPRICKNLLRAINHVF